MLNENNKIIYLPERNPMKTVKISSHGAFACRRPCGEGYYDEENKLTWISWNEKGMSIWCQFYDHNKEMWSKPELACDNYMFGPYDYHNYAVMVKGKHGLPIIFFAVHCNELYMVKKELSGNWTKRIINTDHVAYPAAVARNGIIYLFYSQNTELTWPYRVLRMIKSKDYGDTWSNPRTVIDSQKKMLLHFDEVYQCGCEWIVGERGNTDRIFLTWSMWGGPYGHAREVKGAYFAEMHLDDECFYDGEGVYIGKIIKKEDICTRCLIEESRCLENPITSFGPVAINEEDGRALVVYGIYENGGYQLRCAHRSGKKWYIEKIADRIHNVEDIKKDERGIRIVVGYGNAVVILEKNGESKDGWELVSSTYIKHENKSNSFSYINFIDQGTEELELMVGCISCEPIDVREPEDGDMTRHYYEGIWPVWLLGGKYE